jgi:hypothetical protein
MAVRQYELRNPGAADGLLLTTDESTVSFNLLSTGAELVTLAKASGASAAIAALTENSGAIGGTNDGDLPDLTTPSAAGNTAAVRELATHVNNILAALRVAKIIAD